MGEPAATPDDAELVRGLATIVSADVAGFSQLIADDEQGTVRIFRGHSEIFAAVAAGHRGRILTSVGNAILAEFASPVEAVRAATEIQSALRTLNDQLPEPQRVHLRIGIHLGEFMIQGDGLLGDAVNIAARLQTAAEPGGICVTGSVRDQIRNKLSLKMVPLGDRSFENIAEVLCIYAIAGAIPPTRSRRPGRAAVGALVLLLVGGGLHWAMRPAPAPSPGAVPPIDPPTPDAATGPRANDGIYAGPVCYGAGPNAVARCFRVQATIVGSEITGQWGLENGYFTTIVGTVSTDGSLQMEFHPHDGNGQRIGTANLVGTVAGGQLHAEGKFIGGRDATADWHRD